MCWLRAIPSCRGYLDLQRGGLRCLILNRSFSSPAVSTPNLDGKCWQVSSHGRCCSTRGIISYGSLKASGYSVVRICNTDLFVHRLVAFAFLGPPADKIAWEVHHRDGDPANNRIENLEYVTRSENMRHAWDNPLRTCGGTKNTKKVMWRAASSEVWNSFDSITLAAKHLCVSPSTVSHCCYHMRPCKGLELQFEAGQEEGEEWRQMIDPKSGCHLSERTISSFGRMRFGNGRISTGHLRKEGYRATTLLLSGQTQSVYVHRLVAAAFLGKPPSRLHTHVNHKDGNKGNNALSNLEYTTPAENAVHWRARSSNVSKCTSDVKSVMGRLLGSSDGWTTYCSMSSAAKELGVHEGCISKCVNGRYRQTGGYEFRLAAPITPAVLPGEEWRKVDLDAHLRDRAWRRSYFAHLWCLAMVQLTAQHLQFGHWEYEKYLDRPVFAGTMGAFSLTTWHVFSLSSL